MTHRVADSPPVTTTVPRRAATGAALLALTLVPALAGCSSEPEAVTVAKKQQSTSDNVPLKSCDQVQCTGDLDGAA